MDLRNEIDLVKTLTEQGVTGLTSSRWDSIRGPIHTEQKSMRVLRGPITDEVLKELSTIQNGINFIMSFVKNPNEYDTAYSSFKDDKTELDNQNIKERAKTGFGLELMSKAFGGNASHHDTSGLQNTFERTLIFEGLSNIIKERLCESLTDLSLRKRSIETLLTAGALIPSHAFNYYRWRTAYQSAIYRLYDRNGWHNALQMDLEATESFCGVHVCHEGSYQTNSLVVKTTEADLLSMYATGLSTSLSELRVSGKKCVITNVEPVDAQDVYCAVKKINTVVDTSSIKVYKINRGFKVMDSATLLSYYGFRNTSEEKALGACASLEGQYMAILEGPETTFVSVGSSLGRAVSSCSKRLQDGVMNSLDLSDLI